MDISGNHFTLEVGTKLLIILLMNDCILERYKIEGSGLYHPATVEVTLWKEGHRRAFKFVTPFSNKNQRKVEYILFDPINPPPDLIGSNGQKLSSTQKSIVTTLGKKDTDDLAETFAKYILEDVNKAIEKGEGDDTKT